MGAKGSRKLADSIKNVSLKRTNIPEKIVESQKVSKQLTEEQASSISQSFYQYNEDPIEKDLLKKLSTMDIIGEVKHVEPKKNDNSATLIRIKEEKDDEGINRGGFIHSKVSRLSEIQLNDLLLEYRNSPSSFSILQASEKYKIDHTTLEHLLASIKKPIICVNKDEEKYAE